MANPPFNVSGVDKEKLKDDPRFRLGLPSTDIANYLWIQIFYHALSAKGRAGFVMANSAADARGSELEIRKKLIQSGAVDVIVSVGPNFFYTVTLPATLWFFDKGKPECRSTCGGDAANQDTVLFLDARHIFRQIDRAHREFTPEQVEFLANIVRLYRGKEPEFVRGSEKLLKEKFPKLEVRRRGGPVQSGDAQGNRGAGLELESGPVRGRGGGRRSEQCRLQGAVRGTDRGTGNAQRRGAGTGGTDRQQRGEDSRNMNPEHQPDLPAKSQFLVYAAEDGRVKIEVRLEGETVWLTQQHMAELFQTTQQNISLHLQNIYAEGELRREATHKEFLSVRQEASREVSRALDFYNLDAIISVGDRVKSAVATRFLNRSDPRKTPRGLRANGALTHQPRATPWELVHPHHS